MNNTKIAVYGTLKKGRGNHRLLKDQTFIGNGKTKNSYAMCKQGIPYVFANVSRTPITVEVYDVTEEGLKWLDNLEGHPDYYQRRSTPIILDNGEEIEAELYFYSPFDKVDTEEKFQSFISNEVTDGVY